MVGAANLKLEEVALRSRVRGELHTYVMGAVSRQWPPEGEHGPSKRPWRELVGHFRRLAAQAERDGLDAVEAEYTELLLEASSFLWRGKPKTVAFRELLATNPLFGTR